VGSVPARGGFTLLSTNVRSSHNSSERDVGDMQEAREKISRAPW
jgi:hypothetical protein